MICSCSPGRVPGGSRGPFILGGEEMGNAQPLVRGGPAQPRRGAMLGATPRVGRTCSPPKLQPRPQHQPEKRGWGRGSRRGGGTRPLRPAPPRSPRRPAPLLPRRGARPSLGDVVPAPGLAGGRRGFSGGLRFPGPPAARPGGWKGPGCQSGSVSGGSEPGIPPAPPPSSGPANNKCLGGLKAGRQVSCGSAVRG